MLIKKYFNKFKTEDSLGRPNWCRFQLIASFLSEFRHLFSPSAAKNIFIPKDEYEKIQDNDNIFAYKFSEKEKSIPYKGQWMGVNFYTHSMNNYLLFDDKKNLLEIEDEDKR